MIKKYLFSVVSLMLVFALATTGCRSRKGGRLSSDNIGGEMGADSSSLPPRIEGSLNILTSVKYDAVLFDYDSAQIRESERSKLEAVSDYLKNNRDVGGIIEGNCDERGSEEYTLAVGERRALAARAYLVGLGIDGARIQTKSYGEENPVDPGHDESAWSKNRRAEFVFFKH